MSDTVLITEQAVAVLTVEVESPPAALVATQQAVLVTTAAQQGLAGAKGEPGEDGSALGKLVIEQLIASDVWTLAHNLGRYPGLTLVDSAGDAFDADSNYVDENLIVVTLIAPTSGRAFLN